MKRQHLPAYALVGLLLSVALVAALLRHRSPAQVPAGLHIICTTFPIHQITRNVALGRDGARIELMLPAQLGCPHHYSLTPQDMRRLARADVLVINGLGLETFLGAPIHRANPRLTIIDSSSGIRELLPYTNAEAHEDHEDHEDHGQDAHAGPAPGHACDQSCHGHAAPADGINPHLFASPRQVARLAMAIAEKLAESDPEWAATYSANAHAYARRMDALADSFAELGRRLRSNRIIQPHGVFDYLARDMGIEIAAVMQPHGQEPSAAEMLELVATIRARNVAAIVTEPQYPDRVGRALAQETGIAVVSLDPGASGPDPAPLDYLEQVMRRNLETLARTLETH